jgi:hypothetical protein
MQKTTNLSNLMVIDIETVASHATFEELPENLKSLWEKKAARISPDSTAKEAFDEKAGIYAEFGKIVVIGIGFFTAQKNEDGREKQIFRVKSLASDNEKQLLEDFIKIVEKFGKNLQFVAHNGKEFDFPYLCRRMLINGLDIPYALDISGKKPWEINHIDTMHMWKFGDYKNFTSLSLLAAVFGLATSKDDIDGSEVNGVYYKEKDLNRIAVYCTKDVILTGQLFLRMQNLPIIEEKNIIVVE